MRLLDRRQPVTEEEHERWFAALPSSPDRLYKAIEEIDTGEHIGNVWLWAIDRIDDQAELRIVVGASGRAGRGAGTEAIRLMSEYALGPFKLRRVYAYVLAFNERARRAFEKAGFAPEGVLKADRMTPEGPVDVYVFGRVAGGATRP